MAREQNFLLGRGERLTVPVTVARGGGSKNPPYKFATAKRRLAEMVELAGKDIINLPQDACPNDEVVASMTLHPRYLSKSDLPTHFLKTAGLTVVGSRATTVRPSNWGIEDPPESAVTEELFVSGRRDSFLRLAQRLSQWSSNSPGADELTRIEQVASFTPKQKVRGVPERSEAILLEVVLHNSGDSRVIDGFDRFAEKRGAQLLPERRKDIGGLTFAVVRAGSHLMPSLAEYSFVRVVRAVPGLRPLLRAAMPRSMPLEPADLPDGGPLSPHLRAAVFDGGLPKIAVDLLSKWVRLIDAPGVGEPKESLQQHGLSVTSALLFGPIGQLRPFPLPPCFVDHYRVLDKDLQDPVEYLDVLERIVSVLSSTSYDYINISVGPDLPVEDDAVNRWTAQLDQLFARGHAIVTVAAGNNGENAPDFNRVQPPADAVNVLSVGACDRKAAPWSRANYSAVGPGRCPGVVKPDAVEFAGSPNDPFLVIAAADGGLSIEPDRGTSLAAPSALRNGIFTGIQTGPALTGLSIRTLMIHRADAAGNPRTEVGWGRLEGDPARMITCDDDEALVVYQGVLPVGQHLRASVPLPQGIAKKWVYITATLLIAPEVNPERASTYTRSGMEVAFRPHDKRFGPERNGRAPAHAKSRSFFSGTNLFGVGEHELRSDGHKWEPCLKHTERFRAISLQNPVFDIYYHHRGDEGGPLPMPLPYSLVVSIRVPAVPDFYNQVVRAYSNILVPVQPQIRIQIRH